MFYYTDQLQALGAVKDIIRQGAGVSSTDEGYRLTLTLTPEQREEIRRFLTAHEFPADQLDACIDQAIQEVNEEWVAQQSRRSPNNPYCFKSVSRGTPPVNLLDWREKLTYILLLLSSAPSLIVGLLILIDAAPLWSLLISLPISFGIFGMIVHPKASLDTRSNILRIPLTEQYTLRDNLEQLHTFSSKPYVTYPLKYNRLPTLALILALLLCMTPVAVITATNAAETAHYQAAITAGGNPLTTTGSTGTKFVVYDAKEKKYFGSKYLPEHLCAQSYEEIAAVLKIERDRVEDGKYSDGSIGYRHQITISLYDCVTGKVLKSSTALGGESPKTIRSKAGSSLFIREHYGSDIPDSAIRDHCTSLVNYYTSSH